MVFCCKFNKTFQQSKNFENLLNYRHKRVTRFLRHSLVVHVSKFINIVAYNNARFQKL